MVTLWCASCLGLEDVQDLSHDGLMLSYFITSSFQLLIIYFMPPAALHAVQWISKANV